MKNAPVPDCTQPVTRVYHKFARYLYLKGQGMNLIREAGLSKTSLRIPSWTADWSFDAAIASSTTADP